MTTEELERRVIKLELLRREGEWLVRNDPKRISRFITWTMLKLNNWALEQACRELAERTGEKP